MARASDPADPRSLDRKQVRLERPYEVYYWTKKLGADEPRLRAAVAAVGSAPGPIRAYLKSSD